MYQQQQPSIFDKVKMGLIMGMMMGSGIGLVQGVFGQGHPPGGFWRNTSKGMLSYGAFFSVICSVGSVVRNESLDNNKPREGYYMINRNYNKKW